MPKMDFGVRGAMQVYPGAALRVFSSYPRRDDVTFGHLDFGARPLAVIAEFLVFLNQ